MDVDKKRVKQMKRVQKEGLTLFKAKNKDYGDAFANYGPVGVIMRMGDKISRLTNIEKNKIEYVEDEKMRDTLIDLHNYSAMAILLMDEKDKKDEKDEKDQEQHEDEENIYIENENKVITYRYITSVLMITIINYSIYVAFKKY
jgi:hypothetical protein